MKKVLLISNMYPSRKYPHYGVFVKHSKEILEDAGYYVDISAKIKEDSIVKKVASYLLFYFRTFIMCLHRYDVIYAHYASHVALPILIAQRFRKTKIILNVHGNDVVPEDTNDERYIRLVRKLVEKCTYIICPSDYYYAVMRDNYKVGEEKLVVYPSGGVDTRFFTHIDRNYVLQELGLDSIPQYIGYVSRIEKDKGWDIFLTACAKVIKNNPNIKLIIVGAGAEEQKYESLVDSMSIRDWIIKYDLVSQERLKYLYNAIDVFVFPTYRKSESLGLVGLEAMSCETLTLLPNRYGPTSYEEDKKNCIVFESGNQESLYNAIKMALNIRSTEIERIKKNGRETALKYDQKVTKEILLNLFSKV